MKALRVVLAFGCVVVFSISAMAQLKEPISDKPVTPRGPHVDKPRIYIDNNQKPLSLEDLNLSEDEMIQAREGYSRWLSMMEYNGGGDLSSLRNVLQQDQVQLAHELRFIDCRSQLVLKDRLTHYAMRLDLEMQKNARRLILNINQNCGDRSSHERVQETGLPTYSDEESIGAW